MGGAAGAAGGAAGAAGGAGGAGGGMAGGIMSKLPMLGQMMGGGGGGGGENKGLRPGPAASMNPIAYAIAKVFTGIANARNPEVPKKRLPSGINQALQRDQGTYTGAGGDEIGQNEGLMQWLARLNNPSQVTPGASDIGHPNNFETNFPRGGEFSSGYTGRRGPQERF